MFRSIFILFLMVSTYSNLVSAEQRDPATLEYQRHHLTMLQKSLSINIIAVTPKSALLKETSSRRTSLKREKFLFDRSAMIKNAFDRFQSKPLWETTDRALIKDLHHIVIRLGLSSPGYNLFIDNNKTILITNLHYDAFVRVIRIDDHKVGAFLDQKAYFSSIKKGIIDPQNPYSLKQMFLKYGNVLAANYTDELYMRVAPRIIKGYQSASEQSLVVI